MSRLKKTEYMSISPLVLRTEAKIPFDVFLRHDDNYVLFNGRGRTFTEAQKLELVTNRVANLYIDKKSIDLYRTYILDIITDILDDEDLPLEERAQAWSNSAVAMGKELFEEKLPGPAFQKRYMRFEKLVESTSGFLQSPKSLKHLSKFISKGYETYHHGISTMVYTIALMQEHEEDDYKVLASGMGALLHDIGKSSLPESIATGNPEFLSKDEKDILALHPMMGVRTCASFNLPTIASNCILFHHERADGKGYPTMAVSDELPIHTKIVALCNRYDKLTRNTSYRRAYKPFDALKVIMDDTGFTDKDLLKQFVKMLSSAKIV